jgi:putative colanic acid biosysnthesis UDP-glucose lipid carrier transferase
MLLGANTAIVARGRNSLVSFLRVSVEPVLIVSCLIASSLAIGSGFGAPELMLGLFAFSLTFPGEISVRRLRQNLRSTILVNWLSVAALLVFFGWATRFIGYFDQRMLAAWFVGTPLVLYLAHRTIPYLVPQILAIDGYRSAVIVGANEVGRRLADSLIEEPTFGFRFQGFFDDDPDQHATNRAPPQILGGIDSAAEFVKRNGVETVFIALPMAAQPRLLRLLDDIKDTTASVYFVPDIFITDLIQARIDDINGMPVMAVCETPIVGVNAMLKRGLDLLTASLTLIGLALAMALIALGIKLSSPGPVIFRQRRYGLDGRSITVLKFRTMTVVEDGDRVMQATRNDSRITRFGAFLRSTSLDELPQLFNVLQGTMSMVGPRPHAVAHNEQYRHLIKGYMVRHKVKPGITGWAQVNGFRGETDSVEKMQKRIEFDLEYLRRWSLGLDLLILFKTALIVLRRTNAY